MSHVIRLWGFAVLVAVTALGMLWPDFLGWSVALLILLLSLPGKGAGHTNRALWIAWVLAVAMTAGGILRHLDQITMPLEPARTPRAIAAVVLIVFGLITGYVAGLQPGPATRPFIEIVRDITAKAALGISSVVAGAFFWFGVDSARALGSRLTTAVVSLALVVLGSAWLGLTAGRRRAAGSRSS